MLIFFRLNIYLKIAYKQQFFLKMQNCQVGNDLILVMIYTLNKTNKL